RLSFVRHRGADAIACLLGAARRLTQVDPAWSRACYLDAIEMGILTGGLDAVVREAAAAPAAGPAGSVALLEALVSLVTDGPREAVPALRPLVSDTGHEEWTRRPSLASLLAVEVWDFDAYLGVGHRIVELGRRSGSFFTLPIGLAMAATANVHAGDFGAAVEMISEGAAIAEATGASPLFYPRIHLAALRGRRREAVELFDAVLAAGPLMSISVHWGTAVLNNGLADYPAAFAAARQAVASGDLATAGLALPELIEAALRCGEHEPAASALHALTERTRAGGAWGLGVQAYTRALVTGDEPSFQEAIDRLNGTRAAVYQARAHLLYGEWLRRQGRRREARERLRHAHDLFSDIGMEAFAARAAGELRATGERARNRAHPAGDRLTMQEVHIARLVAGGATSKEVAARLFLSPRTVDAHLRNIFRKLDITSRRQLRDIDL
ncbi:MAG: LuxR family transcriptional regulator, partial [Nonomuraea muscovyensis]|nr:LuxR family transcriptional regulator [Nonomuraea muscovyensis]